MSTDEPIPTAAQASRPAATPSRRPASLRRRLLPLAGLAGLIVFYTILAGERFMTTANWLNLVQQAGVVSIVGFGLTFVVMAGSIDLSVGSVVALCGMLGAMIAEPYGAAAGIVVGLAVGATCGLVNGVICAILKVPSFIVTLGMLSVARGLTILVSESDARAVSGVLEWIGTQPGIYVMLVASLIATFALLNWTTFGRYARAIGGEERVSGLSGVPVNPVKIGVFVVSGLFAGLGGLVLSGQLGFATPQAANGFELSAIAAVVLGGTPLTGGVGNVWNTAIGALIIVVLNNGLVILGVPSEIQQIVQGAILVLAVLVALDRSKIGVIK
jgi:ribose/xylose/arabinose/galactoside ABC-type transport system permease subunit